MAWVIKRTDAAGVTRFQVRFRDVDGVKRTAGTYASRREAVKAGRRSDGKVEDGTWIKPRIRTDHVPRLRRERLVAQPSP